MNRIAAASLLGWALIALVPDTWADEAAPGGDTAGTLAGVWEGPWYRGMTSGKVRLQIGGDGGTIQFTNLDKFGPAPHPVAKATLADGIYQFRTEGESGGALTARLKPSETGAEMKGTGKFDGFPLRFELKRGSQ